MRVLKIAALTASVSLILACNFPMFAPTTQPPSPTPTSAAGVPTDTPATQPPTLTVVPSLTPTATIVPTPSVPQVTPISAGVYCRSGPDVSYPPTSSIALGQSAQIAGRNDDSSWWYVHDPYSPGSFCWVSASVVTTAGNLAGIPVTAPPAAIVTSVTAKADVASPVYCGGPNTIMFSGKITTNGPTKVQFEWEITGDKHNTTPVETVNFKSSGTKDAPDPGAYTADCGNYTITLHVLSPNDISASKDFSVEP
jgi:hypothetical protein